MHPYLIEFIGTAFLVFLIFAIDKFNTICIAISMVLITFIATSIIFYGCKISGGAFNPAVAIAFYITGRISKSSLIPYIFIV